MSNVLLRFCILAAWLAAWLSWASCGTGGWLCGSAQAQRRPEPKRAATPDTNLELELIESTERSEDPLGLDESTGKELDQAAARLPKPKAVVILPAPTQGAALSSIAGVRESAHELALKLDEGLAFVTLRLEFVSTAKHAAEIAYRIPLATSAVVTRVTACIDKLCSEAHPEPLSDAGAPLAGASIEATRIVDSRGAALALRISKIAPGGKLEVSIAYVAEASVRGGRARFRIEARGYDPNLANTELHVDAPLLRAIEPAAELSIEPWGTLEIVASLPTDKQRSVRETRALCGATACSRRFEALAVGPAELRPTWLWIDASPSMEGPARSRVSATLAALLSVLPEATDVRALAFAARASELGRFRAGEAPLVQLADATLLDLDAATQPSSAVALMRPDALRGRPRLVLISDGLFDATAREREALLLLRKQGVEPTLIALGDGEPRLADMFARVLSVAPLAEAALHGGELGPLEDALRGIAARAGTSGLRGGEQRVIERRPKAAWPLRAGASWLSHWLARDRPAARWTTRSQVSSPRGPNAAQPGTTGRTNAAAPARAGIPIPAPAATPTIAAIPYLGSSPPAPQPDTGLPKESVLSMLRTQLVPQARACLRVDRKGRGDYAVGLAFHALFAQREVYEPRVEGHIERGLRSCLEGILPKLRVPPFSGRIRVRYPIYTEREPEPPVIELEPEVERQLERAFSPPRALP